MSGHSKWSKVKHQKAVTDGLKGQSFTKASRAITVAVIEGGGITQPNINFRLRLAIDRAKSINMPKDTITRAIEKGRSKDDGSIEYVLYEGYGPGGIAMLVEGATDNKMRTASQVKYTFERMEGNLASPGSVSYLFQKAGVITIPKKMHTLDHVLELGIEAGADDVRETDDYFEVYTKPDVLRVVSEKLKEGGYTIDNTTLIMSPLSTVSLSPGDKERAQKLIDQLQDLDDIQDVHANYA